MFSINWFTGYEMRESASLLFSNRANGSALRIVFGVMEGARMPFVCNGDSDVQNAYWEGFKQAHEVTNLFVRNFRGDLIFAAVNYTGS